MNEMMRRRSLPLAALLGLGYAGGVSHPSTTMQERTALAMTEVANRVAPPKPKVDPHQHTRQAERYLRQQAKLAAKRQREIDREDGARGV